MTLYRPYNIVTLVPWRIGQTESDVYLHHFPPKVKVFRPDSRLQGVRLLRSGTGERATWILDFEFYPAPRQLFLTLSRDGSSLHLEAFEKKQTLLGFARAEHPLQLYLKAHFVNHRLASANAASDTSLELIFGGEAAENDGPKIHFTLEKNTLEARLSVPGRRDFSKTLLFGKWPERGDDDKIPAASAPVKSEDVAEKKLRRLLANVQKDFTAAEEWMKLGGALCAVLENDRAAWNDPESLTPSLRAFAETMIQDGDLPPFGATQAARAMDLLFMERRRMQRKLQKSAARMVSVKKEGLLMARRDPAPEAAPQGVSAEPAAQVPQKKPGLWVLLKENLWARVGRNAAESDELFRQARDRDLWFHVRGQTGGHVWIPRGQPGFGAKDEASDEIIRLGADLALRNSKAGRNGGGADVDYTERRSLKKIRGEVGRVEILRSKTRYVKVDLKK